MMGRASQRFLEEDFNEDDAAAVLVFNNGLEMLTDFTSDRVLLSQVLGRFE